MIKLFIYLSVLFTFGAITDKEGYTAGESQLESQLTFKLVDLDKDDFIENINSDDPDDSSIFSASSLRGRGLLLSQHSALIEPPFKKVFNATPIRAPPSFLI